MKTPNVSDKVVVWSTYFPYGQYSGELATITQVTPEGYYLVILEEDKSELILRSDEIVKVGTS